MAETQSQPVIYAQETAWELAERFAAAHAQRNYYWSGFTPGGYAMPFRFVRRRAQDLQVAEAGEYLPKDSRERVRELLRRIQALGERVVCGAVPLRLAAPRHEKHGEYILRRDYLPPLSFFGRIVTQRATRAERVQIFATTDGRLIAAIQPHWPLALAPRPASVGVCRTPDQVESFLNGHPMSGAVCSEAADWFAINSPIGGTKPPFDDELYCLTAIPADRALMDAVKQGDRPRAAACIALGANPDTRDGAPLRWAQMANDPRMMKLLLQNGADANRAAGEPLELAATLGQVEQARVLLDFLANPNRSDASALGIAIRRRHEAVAVELLHHGAGPNSQGGNLLRQAAQLNLSGTLGVMLERGGDVAHLEQERIHRRRARRPGKDFDPVLSTIERHLQITAAAAETAPPLTAALPPLRATTPRRRAAVMS